MSTFWVVLEENSGDDQSQNWSHLKLRQLLPVGFGQGFDLVLHPLHHQVQLLHLLPQVLHVAIVSDLQFLFQAKYGK